VVLLAFTRRRSRQPADSLAPRPAAPAVTEVLGEDWPRFGVLTLVIITRSIAYYAVVTFMAVELVGRDDFGLAAAGGALTAFTAVGALGTLTGGYLTRRFERVSVIVVAYLAAIPCLAAVLLAPGVLLVLVAAGLLGLALNVPLPLHTTLGAHYLPRHPGTAAGITLGVAVSIGGLSTPFLGMVADVQGPRTVLLAATALPAVAAVLAILLRPRRPAA
jgi:FSR family fosmidomycin resistance protein-like MFS transporter